MQADLGKGFLRGRLGEGGGDGKRDDKQATRLFVNDRLAPFPEIPDAFRERTFAFRPKPTR
ncbi:hypothetical protein, partial [Mesorhizobium sp.]|uniref:hypothetical protein n=1 Tax=Mesorhizobium sp. TaxID=1871066 RepID=UPI002579E684